MRQHIAKGAGTVPASPPVAVRPAGLRLQRNGNQAAQQAAAQQAAAQQATQTTVNPPSDGELCKAPASLEEKIRCKLIAKPAETDAAATETWMEDLRGLFKTALTVERAAALHTRLTQKQGDDFTVFFEKQLSKKGRNELLTYLAAQFLPKKSDRPTRISDETIGRKIAEGTKAFPTSIAFGLAMGNQQDLEGKGVLASPAFWAVEYEVVYGDRKKLFMNSKAQPEVLPQLKKFLENDPVWKNDDPKKVTTRVRVGSRGASAAVEDLLLGVSGNYAFECFTAATLIQLHGFYLAYLGSAQHPSIGRAAFDRDFNAFVLERPPVNLEEPEKEKPSSSLNDKLAVSTFPQISLTRPDEIKKILKPGDEVPIQNPYLNVPWAVENSVYLGNGEFYAFPKGKVTLDEYVAWVATIASPFLRSNVRNNFPADSAGRQEFVRRGSYIASYSRPKERSINLP
jgi:Protein-glutamine gamma-glutamyltransferase